MRASLSEASSFTEANHTSPTNRPATSVVHKREEKRMAEKLHPKIDNGLPKESASFSGGTLVCACTSRPVKVKVKGQIAHNHACGCTTWWKLDGAIFSVVAVAGTSDVTVAENGDKLKVVDPAALILRHACTGCGVHMYGPV